jgi:flagellar biosynthesis protein FlhA
LITTATVLLLQELFPMKILVINITAASAQPRALYITAGALAAGILIPGFPKISLILLSGSLAGLAYLLTQTQQEELQHKEIEARQAAAKESKPESVLPLIQIDPLEVEIGYNLIPLVDPEQGGTLLDRITNIRRRSALDMGLIVPPIRIRDNMELEPEVYSILIKGVEVGRGKLQVGKLMAMDSGDVREKITGVEFIEPVFNLNAIWIETDVRDLAESRGYTVVDCPTIIATHLTEIIKRHADEILGREEVKNSLIISETIILLWSKRLRKGLNMVRSRRCFKIFFVKEFRSGIWLQYLKHWPPIIITHRIREC